MDIDGFLERELSELGLPTEKTEQPDALELPHFQEDFEPSRLFGNIKANLSRGSLDEAEQSYIRLWHILLQQKLKWNKELYEQLSILSRQFSSALNQAYSEVKRKADHIYELISRAKSSLKEGKKEIPFKLYSEIEKINNSIPNVFFDEKKIIQKQISEFYKELRTAMDNELIKRVSSLIQEINNLVNEINLAIRANDMINAIVNYNKCIELYIQVPEGFLRHKNSIGMRLLEIYKSLSIHTEISGLQKQLTQQPSQQMTASAKSILLNTKKEHAKRNIEKGFYNEASKDIEEVLQLEPKDAEAKALYAKIKTLQ